jgi:DNA polymerase (family 10)
MPVHNADVAALFEEVADLLAIQGENAFRIRAYRNAARTLNQLSRPVADLVAAEEDLSDLPDIGDDLAGKIATIVDTGTLPLRDELAQDIPPAVADLLRIPGLGPKRVRRLRDDLGVDSRADLKRAAEAGEVQALDGFGETMEQNILDGLAQMSDEARWLLARVEPVVASLHDHMSAHDAVERVDAAGSYRRRTETVGDLDVLATRGRRPGRHGALCGLRRRSGNALAGRHPRFGPAPLGAAGGPARGAARKLRRCPLVFYRLEGPQREAPRLGH